MLWARIGDMKSILFVCLGNICRSPSAHGVLQFMLENEPELKASWRVDSAGITGIHAGEKADRRMRDHALRRGLELDSISRAVRAPADFQEFDYLIAMDKRNLRDLYELDATEEFRDKIFLLSHFFTRYERKEVPDPYYGGAQGFELVLDMAEDACSEIVRQMKTGEL